MIPRPMFDTGDVATFPAEEYQLSESIRWILVANGCRQVPYTAEVGEEMWSLSANLAKLYLGTQTYWVIAKAWPEANH